MKNEGKESPRVEPSTQTPPEMLPFKERMYSKVKIPIRVLDGIIWVLVIAIIGCVIIGALKGRGIL